MININETDDQKAIDAYEAWLDRAEANRGGLLTLMVVDGEEFIIDAETDVVYRLLSLERGKLQRNGWYPAGIIEYKTNAA